MSVSSRKVFVCLTGPYLTRRATIGRLEPPLGRGRFVCDPPTSHPHIRITAYTARGSHNGGHHHAQPQRRAPTSRMLPSFFSKTQHGDFPTQRAHDKPQTTKESRALHDYLDLPLTIADHVRSTCPKASRFSMTLATPLVTPAASTSACPSSAQVACCPCSRADDVFVNRQKLR